LEQQRRRNDGAGVLIFSPAKDKRFKGIEKNHPHLEFSMCINEDVANELNFKFPSIVLLRDLETIFLPDHVSFENTEGIDLWLMRKWYSTVTELTMENQNILFSPDTGSLTTLIYLDQLGTERHLKTFGEVAKMWSTKELRNDLPRAVYASKFRLLQRIKEIKEAGYAMAVNTFWNAFESQFLNLSGEDETSTNVILMINMEDPMGIKRAKYDGDHSDSTALSSWVSSIVRKWNTKDNLALPESLGSTTKTQSIEL